MLIEIASIGTPSLGDQSYLASDGSKALVIDPQRDFDRVLALAAERGVRITHVFETHIHNDYVTGGLALARAVGAAYHVSSADQVSFGRTRVADGDQIQVGNMLVRVIATPGHTFNHLSYAVEHSGRVVAVFTGGSLLYGSTGRTDLLGSQHRAELARAQHGSARRLASELPGDTEIWPTHGFGSFCSATPTSGTASTIGTEMKVNPALTMDEDDYVKAILAGLDVYPAYYVHMAATNSAGPLGPDLTPARQAEAGELRRRIEAGEWVVDLRSRVAFAAGHLPGTLQFEVGDNLATYLGWLIPWDMPLTLIGQTTADVAAAQRELVRIGIDLIQAAATGEPDEWAGGEPLSRYPVTNFAGYTRLLQQRQQVGLQHRKQLELQPQPEQRELVLLDVRRDSEWDAARIANAVHIPLHELASRIAEIPAGEVWVHCKAGYRASVAASLLDAAGRSVVLIDDDFSNAERSGLAGAGSLPAS